MTYNEAQRRSSRLRPLEPLESNPILSLAETPLLNLGASSGRGDTDLVLRPRDEDEFGESREWDRCSLVVMCFENGQLASLGEEGGDGSGVVTGERVRGESDRKEVFVRSEWG